MNAEYRQRFAAIDWTPLPEPVRVEAIAPARADLPYVYVHRRGDDGSVFYVGKGRWKYRFSQKTGRNIYWQRVAEKYGWSAEVVCHFQTHEDALRYEVELIAHLRDAGVKLTNITVGGDGASGYKQTPEHVAKRVASIAGKKWTDERRAAAKGKTLSLETRAKLSKAVTGFRHTDEAKMKISDAQRGNLHHLYSATLLKFCHPDRGIVAMTQQEIKETFSLHPSNLCSIIKGRRKSCSGWVYLGVAA